MSSLSRLRIGRLGVLVILAGAWLVGAAASAGAQEMFQPQCFKPMPGTTKTISNPAKAGPWRLALVNGFVGNSWRIQMIQSLKAWATRPENAKNFRELKIVSTGTDVAAQIAAIDNLIAAGYDGIIFIAVSPTAFKPVIARAKRAGTILSSFDNVVDSEEILLVNEPQVEFEQVKSQFVFDNLTTKQGKVLEVRGLPGNSVDRDRSIGFHNVFDKKPGIETVTVVGNWDDGTVQKVVSDAVATHGQFIGMVTQHGTTGLMNALKDAKHPKIPIGGAGENGSLRMIHDGDWTSIARVQSPALSVVAMKGVIALLEGKKLPQHVGLPVPTLYSKDLKDGANYSTSLPDNFQAGADFKDCDVVLPFQELLKQTPDNT
jgi:ribose transport system substrate-binding protein